MKATIVLMAMLTTYLQPAIAQVTQVMPPLPWGAQFGVIGILGSLLWWLVAKTLPQQSESNRKNIAAVLETHKECSDSLTNEIKGLRCDVNAHQQEQIKVLREAVAKR